MTAPRLGRLFLYGLTMAAGTLGLFYYAQPQGETYALTLAFTAFVLLLDEARKWTRQTLSALT